MQLTRRQCLASAAAVPLVAGQRQRPNILFICSDDHHFQALGTAGNRHIQTPNLDHLAARGVHFTDGICSTPQCAPSRGILLTGLESYQNGLESNGRLRFRPGQGPTVIEQLRLSGYETNLIGKWHISPSPDTCGFSKAPLWHQPGAGPYINPKLRRGLDARDEKVLGHIIDIFTDAAIDSIRSAKQPFLTWLAYTAPHTPWSVDDKYRRLYEGRNTEIAPPAHPKGGSDFDWVTYYAVISHLDNAIGRLVRSVEKAGIWDNTLIVFMGDNGYMCGTKGLQGKVVPWDESVRVPYFAAGGLVKARAKLNAPVASLDLPATFLDFAGVKPAYRLAGESLRSELETGRSKREAAFASWNDGRPEALVVRRAVEPYRVVRTHSHKYILWESKKEALFDLQADPAEEKNLADDTTHSKIVRKLRGRLADRMRETNDPAQSWMEGRGLNALVIA